MPDAEGRVNFRKRLPLSAGALAGWDSLLLPAAFCSIPRSGVLRSAHAELAGESGVDICGADRHKGLSPWTQEYPRADRFFSMAPRRLTRIDVRGAGQPVNLEGGDARTGGVPQHQEEPALDLRVHSPFRVLYSPCGGVQKRIP